MIKASSTRHNRNVHDIIRFLCVHENDFSFIRLYFCLFGFVSLFISTKCRFRSIILYKFFFVPKVHIYQIISTEKRSWIIITRQKEKKTEYVSREIQSFNFKSQYFSGFSRKSNRIEAAAKVILMMMVWWRFFYVFPISSESGFYYPGT